MRPVISFQTLEEAWFGAVKNNWGLSRRNGLSQHLAQYDVVWPTPAMVDISANLRSAQERAGTSSTQPTRDCRDSSYAELPAGVA